mgnify:CR=1 FL=1|jgi:hypothetical protein
MKVGDLVQPIDSTIAIGIEGSIHMIIGPGSGAWDWELLSWSYERQEAVTWHVLEEELQVIIKVERRWKGMLL